MSSFLDFELVPTLQATLAELSLVTPTEIQREALPALLQGRSLVGVAETGSGKTLTYVLPMLSQLKQAELEGSRVTADATPRGLVLVPSRELGEQVAKVFKQFTHDTRVRVRTVLGGSAADVARRNVSGPFEVLVATPGRLRKLLDAGAVHLTDVRTVVFDEADQMLDPGFLPDAAHLVGACPPHRQLALFSATLPTAIETLIGQLFRSPPLRIQTRGSHRVVPTLTTVNRKVVDGDRMPLLRTVLAEDPGARTLLFVNTREQSDKLVRALEEAGVPHAVYRGEMDKQERRQALAAFREGTVSLLIATDLASRGLDVEDVVRVVNYHLPHQVEAYLHRVGRTARAGKPGLVINFVTERDAPMMVKLEKLASTAGNKNQKKALPQSPTRKPRGGSPPTSPRGAGSSSR